MSGQTFILLLHVLIAGPGYAAGDGFVLDDSLTYSDCTAMAERLDIPGEYGTKYELICDPEYGA